MVPKLWSGGDHPSEKKIPHSRPQRHGHSQPHIEGHIDEHEEHAEGRLDDVEETLEYVPTIATSGSANTGVTLVFTDSTTFILFLVYISRSCYFVLLIC